MITMKNAHLNLTFDADGRLASLTDAAGSVRVPIDAGAVTAPFEIQLRDTETGAVTVVEPDARPAIACTRTRMTAVYRLTGPRGVLDVTMTVRLGRNKRVSDWRLDVRNGTDLAIWQVAFPRIGGLTEFADCSGPAWLASPFGMGEKQPDPVAFVNGGRLIVDSWARSQFGCFDVEGGAGGIAFSYPGMWTMQYLSFMTAFRTMIAPLKAPKPQPVRETVAPQKGSPIEILSKH